MEHAESEPCVESRQCTVSSLFFSDFTTHLSPTSHLLKCLHTFLFNVAMLHCYCVGMFIFISNLITFGAPQRSIVLPCYSGTIVSMCVASNSLDFCLVILHHFSLSCTRHKRHSYPSTWLQCASLFSVFSSPTFAYVYALTGFTAPNKCLWTHR